MIGHGLGMAFAGTGAGSSKGGGVVAGVEAILITDVSELGSEGRVLPCASEDMD